ncbi:hypothetical protein DR62_06475 [Burkholderia thailandensis]|uniref:Uncharacterized protein n=1 Tax=Burkholderia thailandensis TaxID=57975 RepID=A0AAW9CZ90_BURTH|nr:hypothetical protein DR62_06475 [Burkholderia thailandensis]AOI52333.1 hypothetical protein WI24_11380 [Burkholderia thailandensis]AOJ51313.1 hypothetical protein AQ475_11180 [Burkholderia thailandensis]AOJ56397.1 hypothetical protein AQ477_07615 [Burkholderia thailandensis]KXF62141.1 hypothetical protein AQ476_13160 [Burkholderia thailandensis]
MTRTRALRACACGAPPLVRARVRFARSCNRPSCRRGVACRSFSRPALESRKRKCRIAALEMSRRNVTGRAFDSSRHSFSIP